MLFDPILPRKEGNGINALRASIGSAEIAQILLSIYYTVECEYQYRCGEEENFERTKIRRFLAQLMWAINQFFMVEAESNRCDRNTWFHSLARPDMSVLSLPDDDNDRRCSICFGDFAHSPGDLPSEQREIQNDNQDGNQDDDEIGKEGLNPEMNDPELTYRTACDHVFGKRCLDKWMKDNGDWRGARCPICRWKFPSCLEGVILAQNGSKEPLWLQGLMGEGDELEYLQNRRKYYLFINDATLALPLSRRWKRKTSERRASTSPKELLNVYWDTTTETLKQG